MYSLLSRFVEGLRYLLYVPRQIIGLILPVFSEAQDFAGLGKAVKRTLAVIVLVAVVVLAGLLNHWLEMDRLLKVRAGRGTFPFWEWTFLPLVVLLLVAIVRVGWWLYQLLRPEDEVSTFPDIDQAWQEALRALAQADIDLRNVPLFLVLGRPQGGEEALFKASGLVFAVEHTPPRPDAPLHVWGNPRDGVFVTCTGASRLGPQAVLLGMTAKVEPEAAPAPAPPAEDDFDPMKTVGGANRPAPAARIANVFANAIAAGRGPAQMTEAEQHILRMLEKSDSQEEAARLTARLKHLCRLIVRDRYPYCPVNGVLVLVPFAAIRNDFDTEKTSQDCRQDLAAAWKVFQVNCPVLAMVSDLETVPGFHEFLERFLSRAGSEERRRNQKQRRLGQRFGWGLDVDPPTLQNLVEEWVQWICRGLFPIQIYKEMLRLETKPDEMNDVVRANSRLYRFMGTMRERQKRLTRICKEGLATKPRGLPLLGGCYLGATGTQAEQQAFVAGVFQRLIDDQNYVSWTPDAEEEEAWYQRWTWYGWVGLGVLGAAVLLGGVWWWNKS